MRVRLLPVAATVLLAAPLAAAPVPAGKTGGGPPVVFQTLPGTKLLDAAKGMARVVAGDQVAATIDDAVKNKLGEKGFAGLDMARPLAGYVNLPDRPLVNPEDYKELSGVLILPVTSEAEFKDLLTRVAPDAPLKLVPVAGNDGLYAVETNDGPAPFPVHVRFLDKSAFVGVNVPADAMAANKLVRPEAIVDPKETALFAARAFPDRYPEAMRKEPTKGIEQQVEQFKALGGDQIAGWSKVIDAYAGMMKHLTTRMMTEAEETGYRVRFDEPTGDLAFEVYTVPKKGSQLAKELAARKPPVHRFGALVTPKSAAALTLQIPMITQDFRDLLTAAVEQGEANLDKTPEEGRPVLAELLKGLRRTVKGDSIDFAAAVDGPDKDGHFTAVGGVSFEDAAPLEKAVKEAVKKTENKELKDGLKFDVDKAEGVNIHQFTPPDDDASAGMKKVFGQADIYLAFGPKGIYAAAGPDAKAAIKAALAAKPAAAKEFDVIVNPKRLGQLVAAANENAGGMFKAVMGEEDKPLSALYVTSVGGDAMTFKFGVNLKVVAKPIAGFWMAR